MPEKMENSASAKGTDVSLNQDKGTILLVEDDLTVRRLASRCLLKFGFKVLEAENGEQALQVWERQKGAVDLLFTDFSLMEDMNGLELTNRLRLLKPDLKVIISSGDSDPELLSVIAKDPNICYLAKPFQTASLGGIIKALLEK